MNHQVNFTRFLLITVLIFSTYLVIAGPPPAPTDGSAPNNIPLDGGLIYLTAIGAIIGIRKLFNSKK